MPENLTTIEAQGLLDLITDMKKRIRVLETEVLRLRSYFQPVIFHTLSTGDTNMLFDEYSSVKVTPNLSASYTTTVPPAGYRVSLMILTSGTSSYTITFSTGFKSTGTLATGTVSSRIFVVQFISDGTNLYETSRTVAMVA
jgi:hypothetical protein